MKVSFEWLKDYVQLDDTVTADAVADRLTFAGNEVEGIEKRGAGLDKVIVGEILEIKPHPDADRLQVTQTTTGKETHQIVCGAKNIKVGQKIPVAVVGADLPVGIKIKASKIRGVESKGMLCSADELKLEVDQKEDGIFILDAKAEVGQPFVDYMNLTGSVLDVSVTPNRGDVLSHVGMAREVSALYEAPLKVPEVRDVSEASSGDTLKIENAVGADCPVYLGQLIEGVKVGPSPAWLRAKIESIGLRSINNVVDITSFVMFEIGQPLHAFDADTLKEGGKILIKVRDGVDQEKFHSISHEEFRLVAGDIVIGSGKGGDKPAALAGVMGSADTEVQDKTVNVLLESAIFNPVRVRRTAARTSLFSDASYRFERQVDHERTRWAMQRAAALIRELAGGKVYRPVEAVESGFPKPVAQIRLRAGQVERLLGMQVDTASVVSVLRGLGFNAEPAAGESDVIQVDVPSWRHDISMPEDLIEEYIRVIGYDKIEARLPIGLAKTVKQEARGREELAKIRDYLTDNGFFEAVNFSFSHIDRLGEFYEVSDQDKIDNPISQDFTHLKRSLLPDLMQNLRYNFNHQQKDLRFFEVRKVFEATGERSDERLDTGFAEQLKLAMLCSGRYLDGNWADNESAFDFYRLKGMVDNLFASIRRKGLQYVTGAAPDYFHPGQSCQLRLGRNMIGHFGQLHPRLTSELNQPVFALEINLNKVLEHGVSKVKYKHFGKFPHVERDFSAVVKKDVPAQDILSAVQKVGKPYLQSVEFFDVYTGERVPDGCVSYAFRVNLASDQHTMSDKEIAEVQAKIMGKLENDFAAQFAGK